MSDLQAVMRRIERERRLFGPIRWPDEARALQRVQFGVYMIWVAQGDAALCLYVGRTVGSIHTRVGAHLRGERQRLGRMVGVALRNGFSAWVSGFTLPDVAADRERPWGRLAHRSSALLNVAEVIAIARARPECNAHRPVGVHLGIMQQAAAS